MKFYGNGIVWDAIKNKQLCKFINGEFSTTDQEIITYLINKDYEHSEEKPAQNKKNEVNNYCEINYTELKKLAKEKGINSYKLSKEELVTALEKAGD